MDAVKKPLFVIVDGSAYAHRAFHAIEMLSAPDGSPTNAVFGFIKMLDKLCQRLLPTHLLVVWDGGLAVERLNLFPDYKANRPPMAESLKRQISIILEYLEAARIPYYLKEGVEADDYIATVARRATEEGAYVVIASPDKDFLQLVSENIGIYNPKDESDNILTVEDVKNRTGVTPHQIIDWLTLVGDSVDNIPGVEGVGPKTASTLLQKFGSIEQILANIDSVSPPRIKENILKSREILCRNKDLIKLNCNVQCDFSLEDYALTEPDNQKLNELFKRLGFKSLLKETEELKNSGKKQFVQGNLFNMA